MAVGFSFSVVMVGLSGARQYGGYGGGGYGGGFVECCEGVVDPIFLFTIIAGM